MLNAHDIVRLRGQSYRYGYSVENLVGEVTAFILIEKSHELLIEVAVTHPKYGDLFVVVRESQCQLIKNQSVAKENAWLSLV